MGAPGQPGIRAAPPGGIHPPGGGGGGGGENAGRGSTGPCPGGNDWLMGSGAL